MISYCLAVLGKKPREISVALRGLVAALALMFCESSQAQLCFDFEQVTSYTQAFYLYGNAGTAYGQNTVQPLDGIRDVRVNVTSGAGQELFNGNLEVTGGIVKAPASTHFQIRLSRHATHNYVMNLTLGEDDNSNGSVDYGPGNPDDYWEYSHTVTSGAGYQDILIPLTSFVDTPYSNGNGIMEMTAARKLRYVGITASKVPAQAGINFDIHADLIGLTNSTTFIPVSLSIFSLE